MNQEDLLDLYNRYGHAVRARCRAVCGNAADADDLVQETFLAAWRARRFDGMHPLAWLHTIARNRAIDLVRKRRPWSRDPEAWLALPAPTHDRHDRVDLERLLDAIDPEDAVFLRLRYAESWRIREIAEHFGTSQRTVRRRLEAVERRARVLLRVREVRSA